MIRAALVVAAIGLAGCTSSSTVLDRRLVDRIPPTLLTCAPRPAADDLSRQSDVAAFVVDLDAAGEDCRRKVDGIRTLVETDAENGGRRRDRGDKPWN